MRHKIKPTGRKSGHKAVSIYADGSTFFYIVVNGSECWDSKGCNRELHAVQSLKAKWAKEKAKRGIK